MPEHNKQQAAEMSRELEAEAERKAARMEYARRAGILLPEIAAMPDGGRAFFGEETWQRLQDYAVERQRGSGRR